MYKTHSKEEVLDQLSKLKPLKYNQFRWWRKWDSPTSPLPSKSPLLNKIKNGDLNFSHYFWQAQHSEIELNEKHSSSKDYHQFLESSQLDKARRKRLWEDFIKDEDSKLEYIEKSFTQEFFITKSEYYSELETFDGTLEEFYYHCQVLYGKRPKLKSRRGRPPKRH